MQARLSASGNIALLERMEMGSAKYSSTSGLEKDSSKNASLLAVCVAGIYVCYLVYGLAQESIYRFTAPDGSRFKSTLFMLCCQCVFNSAFAAAMVLWNGAVPLLNVDNFWTCYQPSFAYIAAMLASNEALKYVAYPTQAVAKSCKMVPVMLMGVVINNRKYSAKQYVTVLVITTGITIFNLNRAHKKQIDGDDTFGLALLAISLTLDGLTGPLQEGAQKRAEIRNGSSKSISHQMMLCVPFTLSLHSHLTFRVQSFLQVHECVGARLWRRCCNSVGAV
jgi:hypothetical protein